MAREPQYIAEYVVELNALGPTAFQVKYRGAVLLGVGMIAKVSERPLSWRRRTLASIELDELTMVPSIAERIWRIRKDPGAQRGAAITVGQSADNDIVLPEYTVSTEHAAFNFDAVGLSIMDLGSLNGTRIDGVLIEPHANCRLKDKAQIVMGRIRFDFLNNDSFVATVRKVSDYR